MLFPYSTDTPLYHLPIATGCSIVAITAASIAFWIAPETTQEQLVLWHGDGLHPTQWLTSMLVHSGPVHLIGNMVFLWAFGLIVEGKAGPGRFLLLFLGIGVAQSAVEQIMMLGADASGSLGASSALFCLLGLAVVWAPYNELDTVLLVIVWPIMIEISVLTFGYIYFAFQVIGWGMAGLGMSSEVLHLMGLLPGFSIGWWMASRGLVDCDGHDLPSIYGDREGQPRPAPVKKEKPSFAQQEATNHLREQRLDEARVQIARYLESGNVDAAFQMLERLRAEKPSAQLNAQELKIAIRSRLKEQKWDKAKNLLTEYLARFEDATESLHLQLAKIVVLVERRPAAGIRLLKKIDRSRLSPAGMKTFKQLAARAQHLQQEGIVELRDSDS